jgi:uncharacterized protein YbaR (Trm112 family)
VEDLHDFVILSVSEGSQDAMQPRNWRSFAVCAAQDDACDDLIHFGPMAIDAELLEILACPLCKEEVKLVSLSESRRKTVRNKFRDKFRGEEPVIEQGLQCVKCHRVYPIVSDIPVMLVEEAFEEA